METWSEPRERGVALCFGECLRALGWKTPFFVPEDQVLAVMGGPSFRAYDQQDRAYLLYDINRELGQTTKPEFLNHVIDWDDPAVQFGELVEKVTAALAPSSTDCREL